MSRESTRDIRDNIIMIDCTVCMYGMFELNTFFKNVFSTSVDTHVSKFDVAFIN